MNKIVKLPLILITLFIVGCRPIGARHIEEEPNDQGIKEVSFGIYADYGQHIKDKVTLLLGSSIIPFNKDKYNIDTLLVGDYVTISYTGEIYIEESYPERWSSGTYKIKDVIVKHGTMYTYEVVQNPGSGTSLVNASHEEFDFGTKYVINKDGSFTEGLNDFPVGTKLYGIHPSHFASKTILAFYSYNPLTD